MYLKKYVTYKITNEMEIQPNFMKQEVQNQNHELTKGRDRKSITLHVSYHNIHLFCIISDYNSNSNIR